MDRKLYLCLALIILTVATYWPVKNHEFVNYDDPDYITANPVVRQGLTAHGVAWAFQNLHAEKTYWHPLTWISHLIDVHLFGLTPAGHHLGNLLFHTLNVVLLFWILYRMTGAVWPSAVVTALFAIHPLQVDTVAWVTERKNVLSTFLMLLGLLAYVRYAARPTIARYAWIFFLFCAALMSKPAVVTFPCLLLLLDFWPLRRIHISYFAPSSGDEQRSGVATNFPLVPLRHAILEKLPLLLLSIASCAVTLLAHRGLGMLDPSGHLPLRLRLENAVVSYARYLGKILWPDDLAVLYPHPGQWPFWEVVLSGMLLLAVTALVLRRAKFQPYLLAGWFWFLGTLIPAIGIVQVGAQSMADRFAYIPIAGIFVMIVWTVAEFTAHSPARQRLALIVAGIVVGISAGGTLHQLSHWKNSITLWQHTLRVTTNNFMAHHDLGVALRESGRLDDALPHFQAALRIRENALSHFEMGQVLERQGRTNDAITQMERSVALAPRWATGRERLAFLLTERGDVTNALAHCSELLRLAPQRTDIRIRMAVFLSANDRAAEAITHYHEALRSKPNDIAALNNLAWIFATHPEAQFRNGAEAVELAFRACTLTGWKSPTFVATLAAAQAEMRNFQQAVDLATQARTLATIAGETEAAAECEKLRLLFVTRTPFRQAATR
ncbi:MAG TPA: tetratricopeptide repeat protein [Candidatus Limnocylindria bacterium]|nr:tetratricopeptide repeat protein [Candidatus Limnocylindria bacterium]